MPAGLLSLFMLHQHLDALPSHRALGDAGLDVHACTGPRDLHSRLHSAPVPICAVLVPPNDGDAALLVAFLRANTAAGIIALAPRGEADHRIQAILMGADVCMPASLCARELAACVLALQRRLGVAQPMPHLAPSSLAASGEADESFGQATSPGDSRWYLVNNDWELISPHGVHIALTHNERRLFGALANDPGEVFSRPDLAAALSDSMQEIKASSINMLVSRLRGKARHLGVEVPLGVLPGRGYTLTAAMVRPTDVPMVSNPHAV